MASLNLNSSTMITHGSTGLPNCVCNKIMKMYQTHVRGFLLEATMADTLTACAEVPLAY